MEKKYTQVRKEFLQFISSILVRHKIGLCGLRLTKIGIPCKKSATSFGNINKSLVDLDSSIS